MTTPVESPTINIAPQLIIFDCDGVLVDSEMIASRVLAEYLTDMGRPTTDVECRTLFTGISLKSVAEKVRDLWQMALPQDFVEQLRQRDRAAFAAELKPIAGIHRTLSALRNLHIPFCVASSGTPEKINFSLLLTELADNFGDHIFSASQVTHGKPAPDLFLLAAQTMGVQPNATVVIEDSPAGIKAAVAANMTAVGFIGGSHTDAHSADALVQAGANMVFADMAALPEMLPIP